MLFPLIQLFVIATFSLLTSTCAIGIAQRAPCAESYIPCSPPGATGGLVPPAGDALSGLYFDLVSSVNPQPVKRDDVAKYVSDQSQEASPSICCAQGTECRLLQSYNLPFCWDRFTTNFFLPDGSYGNVFTGHYTSSSGAITNLVSGDIARPDGRTENIYSDNPGAKPATSILPVPTPWTSQGVGSAIPDSRLGIQPTASTTTTQNMVTPTTSISFPSLTPTTSGATPTSTSLNLTAIPSLPTGSMGEPYGYGPPPGATTTSVLASTGLATSGHFGVLNKVLCAVLLASFLQAMQVSFCI